VGWVNAADSAVSKPIGPRMGSGWPFPAHRGAGRPPQRSVRRATHRRTKRGKKPKGKRKRPA
jgi:hypothetical protein